MMMMSSNTVGNHDFNTAGITPLDAQKPKAKKEPTVKLTNAKLDSFERTPRATAPEAQPTAEASAKTGGSNGIVGAVLGGIAAVTALGTAIFVGMKHGETQDALKLAKTTAETAQKEAEKLRTELSQTTKGITEDKVTTLITDAIGTATNDVTELIQGINATVSELGETVQKDLKSIQTETATALDKKADKSELAYLQNIVQAQSEELANGFPKIGGKDVSQDIWELFKPSEINGLTEESSDFAKAVLVFEDNTQRTTSLSLLKAGLDALEQDGHPGSIQTLLENLPLPQADYLDSYTVPFNHLRNVVLPEITQIFGRDRYIVSPWADHPYEPIFTKAQAVVEAAHKEEPTVDEVKIAQKALVEELKNQFGKSKTEQFKADYPNAVTTFTAPTNPKEPNGWVLDHFKPENSFKEMAEVILTGGLNGTDTTNTTVQNADTLATVVLPNLKQAFENAYSSELDATSPQGKAVEELESTLRYFEKALQPITDDALIEPHPFKKKDLLEIAPGFDMDPPKSIRLHDEIITARLEADSTERKTKIENATAEMYDLLRTQLQALKDAKSAVVPKAAAAVEVEVLTPSSLQILNLPEEHQSSTMRTLLLDKLLETPIKADSKTLGNSMEYQFNTEQNTNFDNALKKKISENSSDLIQQEKVWNVLTALLSAKNGEDLERITDVQSLSNKGAIMTAFNDEVNAIWKHVEDWDNQTELGGYNVFVNKMETVIQLIQKGLPTLPPTVTT